MKIRVGFGYDVHRLAEGRTFVLGGVTIPHSKGPMGHSDADVLIHAICDALLGAANLRDIGTHFPDGSSEFKGIDSTILLKKVNDLLTKRGYRIINLDTTICLQEPKIAAVISEIKEVLARVMEISEEDISIKATTTEKLGFVGREEGISAYAVALIQSLS
jgi:2-C-methyl-D-erythritol 2,4-cyclodiphosphate synthase